MEHILFEFLAIKAYPPIPNLVPHSFLMIQYGPSFAFEPYPTTNTSAKKYRIVVIQNFRIALGWQRISFPFLQVSIIPFARNKKFPVTKHGLVHRYFFTEFRQRTTSQVSGKISKIGNIQYLAAFAFFPRFFNIWIILVAH
jgi:hypothetical protein